MSVSSDLCFCLFLLLIGGGEHSLINSVQKPLCWCGGAVMMLI